MKHHHRSARAEQLPVDELELDAPIPFKLSDPPIPFRLSDAGKRVELPLATEPRK